jgi:hypothetical protein
MPQIHKDSSEIVEEDVYKHKERTTFIFVGGGCNSTFICNEIM